MLPPELSQKRQDLEEKLRRLRRVIVAFSGGVDSTLVLKVAVDVLGRDSVIAATGVSPSLPQRELQSVRDLADQIGARLTLVATEEMQDPNYAANPSNRCYYCKTELYTRLSELAEKQAGWAIVNGANVDDAGDFRPGMKAAGEWLVESPLRDAGLTKADVRALAHQLGLANWDKPAMACLSSRIPYGTPVTIKSLSQIERAEAFLRDNGFTNVRVRHHQNLARIEVDANDLPLLVAEPLRSQLASHLKSLGYTYVTIDLQGFRSGSSNEALKVL